MFNEFDFFNSNHDSDDSAVFINRIFWNNTPTMNLLAIIVVPMMTATYFYLEFLKYGFHVRKIFANIMVLLDLVSGSMLKIRFKTKDTSQANHQKDGSIYRLPFPPSPSFSLPLIGHLHYLAKYPIDNPWLGFSDLQRRYGNVFWLNFGQYPAVMISSIEAIKEVLLTKGDVFSNRPNFYRHGLYFGQNRQNALALCDWTSSHKQRRSIAHAAVIPRFGTECFQRLSNCISNAVDQLLLEISEPKSDNKSFIIDKQMLNRHCCAIFMDFLLEKKLNYQNSKHEFDEMAEIFDFILHDINQMYLSDFIPILKNFGSARRHGKEIVSKSNRVFAQIKTNIMERFEELREKRINDARKNWNDMKNPGDDQKMTMMDEKTCNERFVDSLLLHKQYQSSAKFLDFILEHYLDNPKSIQWEECLYEIGDLVGGQAAISNLIVRLMGFLALNPDVQEQLQKEIISVTKKNDKKTRITMDDQCQMPLVNASVMETLRLASSPIVPHFSRWDTSIQNYFIPKGTMVMINVYNLNLSPNLYEQPERFNPARFLTKDGCLIKPEHFFPFSYGRRSCLGYKMVNTITFTTVANLLMHYCLVPANDGHSEKMLSQQLKPCGKLSLPFEPGKCFKIGLVPI